MVSRSERPGAVGQTRSGRATPGQRGERRGAAASGEPGAGAAAAGAPRAGTMAEHTERLRGTIRPVIEELGYDLEDLTVARAGRRSVLRIVVDSDDGVNLDAVADISRAVSAVLDGAESESGSFGMEAYTLEVTSPGVDRPLTEPRHWRRNVGRLVQVEADGRTLAGRIRVADPAEDPGEPGIELDVEGTPQRLRYASLGPGKVQIEFGRLDSGKSDDDLEPGKEEA